MQAASKATLEEAIKVQFAFSKGQPKLPMLFSSLAALRTPTLAHAQTLGLLHPTTLSKLPKAEILAKLATIAAEDHHAAAAASSAGRRNPRHYQRAALELYLDKARPDLHLASETLASSREIAAWHENLLLHRADRAQYRPFVLVHEPAPAPEEKGHGGGATRPRSYRSW